MEAIKITHSPDIYLLVDEYDDTNNPILEVQASVDNEGTPVYQQISLYSEFELDQATEVHKLIVFHSPRDPNKNIDWLKELDAVAYASADWNPYEETYENISDDSSEKTEANRNIPRKKSTEHDDLEYEEELSREFEKEEQERKNRQNKNQK